MMKIRRNELKVFGLTIVFLYIICLVAIELGNKLLSQILVVILMLASCWFGILFAEGRMYANSKKEEDA